MHHVFHCRHFDTFLMLRLENVKFRILAAGVLTTNSHNLRSPKKLSYLKISHGFDTHSPDEDK